MCYERRRAEACVEGGEWRTCAMRDDEPRPVWMSPLIMH